MLKRKLYGQKDTYKSTHIPWENLEEVNLEPLRRSWKPQVLSYPILERVTALQSLEWKTVGLKALNLVQGPFFCPKTTYFRNKNDRINQAVPH